MNEKQKQIIVNSLRTIISALELTDPGSEPVIEPKIVGQEEPVEPDPNVAEPQQEPETAAQKQTQQINLPDETKTVRSKHYSVTRKIFRTEHKHDMYISGNENIRSLNVVFEPKFINKAGLFGQRVIVDIVNSQMLTLKFSKSGYKIADKVNTKNGGARLTINDKSYFNRFNNFGFIPSEFEAEKIADKGIWILTKVEENE